MHERKQKPTSKGQAFRAAKKRKGFIVIIYDKIHREYACYSWPTNWEHWQSELDRELGEDGYVVIKTQYQLYL